MTVSKLPGLVTEGDNLKEAREMVKGAIRCYLEAILKERATSFPGPHKERIRALA